MLGGGSGSSGTDHQHGDDSCHDQAFQEAWVRRGRLVSLKKVSNPIVILRQCPLDLL